MRSFDEGRIGCALSTVGTSCRRLSCTTFLTTETLSPVIVAMRTALTPST
jgi:hypothetical protein